MKHTYSKLRTCKKEKIHSQNMYQNDMQRMTVIQNAASLRVQANSQRLKPQHNRGVVERQQEKLA